MFGVQLADVLTRCSSHPQGKSEARYEKCWCSIGVAAVLVRPCSLVQRSNTCADVISAGTVGPSP